MPFVICVIIAFVVIIRIVDSVKKNGIKVVKKDDISKHEWKTSVLKHTECDISATSCLHEETIDRDEKICRRCGYRNEKGKKSCSVCSKKLW